LLCRTFSQEKDTINPKIRQQMEALDTFSRRLAAKASVFFCKARQALYKVARDLAETRQKATCGISYFHIDAEWGRVHFAWSLRDLGPKVFSLPPATRMLLAT
jgi:hypothetical protein